MAASADGCESVVAVDCFCPHPQNYTTAFLACLGTCPPATCLTPSAGASAAPLGCPSEVPSAEALVEQFCAAAATPTSMSFASECERERNRPAHLQLRGTTSNAAARATGNAGFGVPLVSLALAGAGVLAGTLAAYHLLSVLHAALCLVPYPTPSHSRSRFILPGPTFFLTPVIAYLSRIVILLHCLPAAYPCISALPIFAPPHPPPP
ncbi:hypothetical protein DFH06DRAFT_1344792 [Mycena polygramma]|nr:hypothetical protein DFH06DRAFT_1344792 [Mycena polygramma]